MCQNIVQSDGEAIGRVATCGGDVDVIVETAGQCNGRIVAYADDGQIACGRVAALKVVIGPFGDGQVLKSCCAAQIQNGLC